MNTGSQTLREIECVEDSRQARALLHPLRARILSLARQPASATEMAALLKLPRQRVNYHVRRLADRGLLRKAGRNRKRNMVEQKYVASARGFLIIPEALGSLSADWREIPDTASAAFLLALTAQVQSDVARAWKQAREQGDRLSTLSLKSQFRFESPQQRADFARAVRQAVVDVIAKYSAPHESLDRRSAPGRPYRFVLACYPEPETSEPLAAGTRV